MVFVLIISQFAPLCKPYFQIIFKFLPFEAHFQDFLQ